MSKGVSFRYRWGAERKGEEMLIFNNLKPVKAGGWSAAEPEPITNRYQADCRNVDFRQIDWSLELQVGFRMHQFEELEAQLVSRLFYWEWSVNRCSQTAPGCQWGEGRR